ASTISGRAEFGIWRDVWRPSCLRSAAHLLAHREATAVDPGPGHGCHRQTRGQARADTVHVF
ncbi:MAG: hypothetical protein RLZZ392_234, partial [Pseudomonadota bacterium]